MKKIKNTALLICTLLLLGTLNSCKKENLCDCIKRTGPILMQEREISGFEKLFIEDNINVFIAQDSIFEVIVEAGKNVRGLIRTEVREGTLYISNDNRCNWSRSYKKPLNVYIKMPIISKILSDGTGNIQSLNTITSNEIELRTKNAGNMTLTINNHKITSRMHGSGDITLIGKTDEHSCNIAGTAFLRCQELKTNYTFIQASSTGNSTVFATDLLECNLENLGDVVCYGNPTKVVSTQKGQGKLYLQ